MVMELKSRAEEAVEFVELENAMLQPVWGTVKDQHDRILTWSKTCKTDDHLEQFSRCGHYDYKLTKGFVAYNNSYGNVYHVLREWIAAIAVYHQHNLLQDDVVVLLPRFFDGVDYARNELINAAIAFFGIENHVLFIDTALEAVRVETLFYPKVLCSGFYLDEVPYFGDMMGKLGGFILGESIGLIMKQKKSSPALGYLSRADSMKRRLVNEPKLAWYLHSSHGADIFSMSGKTLFQQVYLFNRYSRIISPHGAGLANLSLLAPDCLAESSFAVLEIMPEDYVNDCFKVLAGEKYIEYRRCLSRLTSAQGNNVHDNTYRCPPEALRRKLEGFW